MEVSLGKLLEQVAEQGTLKVGTVERRTRKDVGFLMRLAGEASELNSREKCYLHTGLNPKGLSQGDELLLSVAPSRKVEDRLDVMSYTRYPRDLVAAIRNLDSKPLAVILPLAYPKLSSSDWANFWEYWLANPKELQTLASALPHDWLSKIVKHCPREFYFKLLYIIKPTARYVWQLITEHYIDASNEDRKRLLNCIAADQVLCCELAEKNLINKNPVSNINQKLREKKGAPGRSSFEIDLGIECLDEERLFHCIAEHYTTFDSQAWPGVWKVLSRDPDIVPHYKKQLPSRAWEKLVATQPVENFAQFLNELEPSVLKLGDYLSNYYAQDSEENNASVRAYIHADEKRTLDLTVIALIGSTFPAELGLSLGHLDINGFIALIPLMPDKVKDSTWVLLWREWENRPKNFVKSVKAGVLEKHWCKISSACPDNLLLAYLGIIEPTCQQIWSYICQQSATISAVDKKKITDYLNVRKDLLEAFSSLPISSTELPTALEFFLPAEKLFWLFITDHWDDTGGEVQGLVRMAIQKAGYIQAGFLLYLVDRAVEHNDYPLHLLSKDVENLVGNLFDHHSLNQICIATTIFMDCPIKRGFSACEASIAPNKNAGEPDNYKGGVQPAFNYWCRRSPCDSAVCLVSHEGNDDEALLDLLPISCSVNEDFVVGGYFYKFVKKFWGYSKSNLHDQSNSAFLRPLAAINRWNELVERLHCRGCRGTLRISEHSPNSINRMAYAVTYWHCADKACPEYARSVKLSHCQGNLCDKIIDSREDRQSCTPWEVRSYKKMYLCTKCGSCCPTHAKSGRYELCPNCGRDKAYAAPPDGGGRMTCIHCDHQVTVPWDKRQQVQDRFYQAGAPQGVSGAQDGADSTLFVLPCRFLDEAVGGVFRLQYMDDKPRLYVYDLFACLKNGYVKNLSEYHKIYDIRLIEKLHYLGQFHNRYSGGDTPLFGLLKHLRNVTSQQELDELAGKVSTYISNLIAETTSNGVINHYEHIELPFTLSLFSLLRGGFTIDRKALTDSVSEVELARNIAVEFLRDKGIDTPTREDLKSWLPYSDSDFDKTVLLNRIDHISFKSIRHLDPVFDAFYRIEKIERMGGSIKSVFHLQGPVLPDYQVVGTSTLRCTSQRPNLLGFPKQLRPVVKASEGRCIVECDYGQMDVGVVAALSNDPVLIADYNSGDVYGALAQELDIDRDRAKLVFLGILYGVGKKTLQLWLEKDEPGAEALLQQFFRRYKALAAYQDNLVQQGERLGYVETVTGVRRSVNRQVLGQSANVDAIRGWQRNWFKNYPVQASSAIVFKRAIIEVAENVEPCAFKLIAPLYDALVFEVPLEQKNYYTGLVCSAMKRAMAAYFPNLKTHVTVNDHNISCWNGGEDVADIKES